MTDGPVPGTPESLENTPSSIPLTRAQRAREAQELWASTYAQEHRVRRRASWVIAAILAVYVSGCAFRILGNAEIVQRFGCAVFAGYTPLQMIMLVPGIAGRGIGPSRLGWPAG